MGIDRSVPAAVSRRFEAAQRLAVEAGALAMTMRPAAGAATLKARQDWLTEADGAVERFLCERLLAAFPEDGFMGEEGGELGGAGRDGALRWVVDPIDGTSNFARGASRWCVSVALMDGPAVLAGVLAAPALGEVYAAAVGGGATLNGAPLRAAGTTDIARAVVEIGWSPRVSTEAYVGLCRRAMEAGAMLRSGGSGALGLAEVAAGRLDGYIELHINLWDCAAALALLHEAGAAEGGFLPGGLAGGGPILAAAPGMAAALGALR